MILWIRRKDNNIILNISNAAFSLICSQRVLSVLRYLFAKLWEISRLHKLLSQLRLQFPWNYIARKRSWHFWYISYTYIYVYDILLSCFANKKAKQKYLKTQEKIVSILLHVFCECRIHFYSYQFSLNLVFLKSIWEIVKNRNPMIFYSFMDLCTYQADR